MKKILLVGLFCLGTCCSWAGGAVLPTAAVSDVQAKGSSPGTFTDATHAAGAFDGNDKSDNVAQNQPSLIRRLEGGLQGAFGDLGAGIFDGMGGVQSDWTWKQLGNSSDIGTDPFDNHPVDATSDKLELTNPLSGIFVLALKASNSYSAYLFDGSFQDIDEIMFNTIGTAKNGGGKAQGLSHASIYIPMEPDFPGPNIPVPEASTVASWLLMGMTGLGLTYVRRRKS